MQTFLPYPDFVKSAKSLDYRRLGKQRLEARQIISAIETGKGWIHHPATKMWSKNVDALKIYHNVIISEWINRGYKNTMSFCRVSGVLEYPSWLGNEEFHLSHRSNLVKKNPAHYIPLFGELEYIPYVWPRF